MSTYESLECIFCGEIRKRPALFGKKKMFYLELLKLISMGKLHTHTHTHTHKLNSKAEIFSQITKKQSV